MASPALAVSPNANERLLTAQIVKEAASRPPTGADSQQWTLRFSDIDAISRTF
jgi:hypothetical protein